jgi:hypothetical protein
MLFIFLVLTAYGIAWARHAHEDGPRRTHDDPVPVVDDNLVVDDTPLAVVVDPSIGNTFVGFGSANWSWARYKGYKFAISFTAQQDKTLDKMWVCWKTANGYGSGTYGLWTFELQQDNPNGHIPSGKVISSVRRMRNPPDGYWKIDLPNVRLQAGTIYHLVTYNIDIRCTKNWSSPNTVMSIADDPWCGNGVMSFDGNTWIPWGSQDNPVNPKTGSRAAYLIQYTDGSCEGMPYYSATVRKIYGGNYEGQVLPWTGDDQQIDHFGSVVFCIGTPAGALEYVIEEVDGAEIASGVLAQPAEVTAIPAWKTVALAEPVLLCRGITYRAYLRATECNSDGCYATCLPYTSEQVPGWPELSWGGTASYSIYYANGAWHTPPVPADLTFKMLPVAPDTTESGDEPPAE